MAGFFRRLFGKSDPWGKREADVRRERDLSGATELIPDDRRGLRDYGTGRDHPSQQRQNTWSEQPQWNEPRPPPRPVDHLDVSHRGTSAGTVEPSRGDVSVTRRVEIRPKPTGIVAVLIGVKGELMDEVYKIRDGENRLGRTRTLEVVLGNDESISREHAIIVHKEGAFFLQPSREAKGNPTRVNGAEVDDVGKVLSDGDSIGMGKSVFCFRIAAPRMGTA